MADQQFTTAEPANHNQLPVVRNIFDFSAEALGQLKTWLEQNPPSIPVTQIVGYNTNTVRIYKKATGTSTIANTTTETDIINESIPAGSLTTTGIMRVTLIGDYLNNSGVGRTVDFKFYFGGTLIFTVSSGGLNSTAQRYPGNFEYFIANLGATNSQTNMVNFPNFGSVVNSIAAWNQQPAAASAIDTTATQTFRVTVTHSFAAATIDYTRRYYMIEFL